MINALNTQNPHNMTFGSRRTLPRYLYHITTENNWQKIKETQELRPSKEFIGEGVFMLNLKNVFQKWTKWSDEMENYPIDYLLNCIQRPFEDYVILRIPTENIDQGKMMFRKINKYFKIVGENKKNTDVDFSNFRFTKDAAEKAPELNYLKDGEKIDRAKAATQKHPIEYIHKGAINTESIEKVGTIPKNTVIDDTVEFEDTWGNFLAGTPEVNHLKNIPEDIG